MKKIIVIISLNLSLFMLPIMSEKVSATINDDYKINEVNYIA